MSQELTPVRQGNHRTKFREGCLVTLDGTHFGGGGSGNFAVCIHAPGEDAP